VETVNERMSYIVLRGRWCNIIILKAHAPTEEKGDDSTDSLYKEIEGVFIIFLRTIRKFCHEILMQKWGKRILSSRQLRMRLYIRIVTIMVLE
jgi:hypothetical protein